MNTKVNKLRELYNMRLNKAQNACKSLDDYLPKQYTSEVIERVKKRTGRTIGDQLVRNVKSFRSKDPDVFKIILEFAKENEKKIKDLEKICE